MSDARGRVSRGAAGLELVRRRFTWAAACEQLTKVYSSLA
jgi:hypothetical protein